jgi:uncharacterized protein YneF (UPF0154 family)
MDEEGKEIKEEDGPETQLKDEKVKEPTSNDFMAGALLANGIIWLWMQSMNMFSSFFNRIPAVLLVDLTYLTFIIAGFISSQQVAKRSERNQLIVALRSALYSWAGSLLMMLTMSGGPTLSFALIVLVCLMIGAVAGSYMLIRTRIIERRRLIAEASS